MSGSRGLAEVWVRSHGAYGSTMDDDAELVDRMQDGDQAAFTALVSRYQLRLLRLAHATVGSRAVAEEVTQETLLAVVRGIERFEGRSSFRTWLYRVLLNRGRTRLRAMLAAETMDGSPTVIGHPTGGRSRRNESSRTR